MTYIALTPEQMQDLQRHYKEHAAAVSEAITALASGDQRAALDADAKAGEAWRQIRALLGERGPIL